MAKNRNEFSKKELIELLNKYAKGGKVSFNDLGGIIFDTKFPDELFKNAKEQIIKARDDEKKYKELANSILVKTQYALDTQKQIVKLSTQREKNLSEINKLKELLRKIENEINPLEIEFAEVKKRIDERKGK